ncbi:hypothetical protein COCCU_06565 [Corynebacterium occultum]|uniref:Uncharacterized protein n=1 Tax=Corynebacterium occultum TaxID=2675219 RepID=A0A6B8W403_9CORY|nr:hypothetical protein [Corynebacterium occultum]QGU07251.1 hypothetical protein COCCU_06565 [Corynebacterium occultum]
MPSNPHHPEESGGSGFSDPASEVRFRYAAPSPTNPWDGRRYKVARKRNHSRILALLILIFGLFILGSAMLYAQQVSSADQASPPSLTTPAPPAPPAPSEAPAPPSAETSIIVETSTVVIVSSAPAEPTPVVAEVSADTPVTEEKTVAKSAPATSAAESSAPLYRAPAAAKQCAANVNWRIFSATEATSCPFAENVAIAMKGSAGTKAAQQLRVASPVTGKEYLVDCQPAGQGSFVCEGGAGAQVVLEHRHDLRPGY